MGGSGRDLAESQGVPRWSSTARSLKRPGYGCVSMLWLPQQRALERVVWTTQMCLATVLQGKNFPLSYLSAWCLDAVLPFIHTHTYLCVLYVHLVTLSYKDSHPIGLSPPMWPYFLLVNFLKLLLPNLVTVRDFWGLGLQHKNLRWHSSFHNLDVKVSWLVSRSNLNVPDGVRIMSVLHTKA